MHDPLIFLPDVMPAAKLRVDVREWHTDAGLRHICFVVGVDLGQSRDFSAIVINEVNHAERTHWQQTPFQPVPGELRREQINHHRLRHVERIPLGTSYPAVVARAAAVLGKLPALPRPPVLVADATGVGRPVMDLMRRQGIDPLAVTITAGSGQTVEARETRVAKRILASGVAVALDTGRLQVVASGPDVETLRNELRAFRVKVNTSQNESFESWREQDHDDLVLAAALAVWAGERVVPRVGINPKWNLFAR